jgi:hypothetical protein
MFKKFLVIATVFSVMTACNEKPDTCEEQSGRQLIFGFYSVQKTTGKSIVRDSIVSGFSAVVFSTSDSLIKKGNIKSSALPLSQLTDTCAFTLHINDKDIGLFVRYRKDLIFENYTCGFRTNFILDTLFTSPAFFDSIVITHSTITDVNLENCKFYFTRHTVK